jgi:hypothetical protein
MAATEITPRAARIVDVEAGPVLELLSLVPRDAGHLSALQIRPSATEGRVLLEMADRAVMAQIEADGDCARPVCIPRGPLAVLRKRHPDAERLVLDQLDAGVGLRSFGPDATVAMTVPEAAALPELPLLPLPATPTRTQGAELPLLLDPVLLARSLEVLRRLGCPTVQLSLLDHAVVGAALAITPSPISSLQGSIQIARCVLPEAA